VQTDSQSIEEVVTKKNFITKLQNDGKFIPVAPCPKCGNKLILVVTPGSYQSRTFGCFNCNRPLSLRHDKAPDSPQPSK
jgi:hypothetical protein